MNGWDLDGPWEDIGHGVSIQRFGADEGFEDPPGFVIRHPDMGGRKGSEPGAFCYGTVMYKTAGRPHGWTLESKEPLTVSPSVLCSCGHHGFVRDGKWVSA